MVDWHPVTVILAVGEALRWPSRGRRERQRWTDDRPGMTLRLPLDLRESITEESRVNSDLAWIDFFALSHIDHDEVEIQQTRDLPLRSSSSRWARFCPCEQTAVRVIPATSAGSAKDLYINRILLLRLCRPSHTGVFSLLTKND